MEAWFLYACVSALFAGLQAVVQKVAIERGLSTVLVNSYGALISGSIAFIILLLSGQPFSITWYAAIIIFMSGAAYMYGVVSRSRAMRYLDVGVVLTSY